MTLITLIAAINNDTSTISKKTGVNFPKHLSDEVCEYLIIQSGYFDFKGRDGLLKKLKHYLPDEHFLILIYKDSKYRASIERMCALRNYAAHSSLKAKKDALKAINKKRIRTAGAWLKLGNNFKKILDDLLELSNEVKMKAKF